MAAVEEKINELKVEDNQQEQEDDIVTPWSVSTSSATGIDYDKLIETLEILKPVPQYVIYHVKYLELNFCFCA
ncbi:unnamed protein product [Caenorhabditis angaria]|uniref:Uncharacterized protein n=1 Tax=Caenorhabditis angaria TaxID=860376 RepID=A0A9P1N7U0_9PELO|nr:unnamed protein product [Caenorhabditis angaria]